MATKKITELTELAVPASDDILAIVDDPSGTPVTKKISITNLFRGLPDGAAAAPGLAFAADQDTGLYRPAADEIVIAAGGDDVLHIKQGYNIVLASGWRIYWATHAYIRESYGVEIHGTATRPVEIEGASLLIGYNSSDGNNYGVGDLLVAGKAGMGTSVPDTRLDIADGAIEGEEISDPGAGVANTWRLYGRDNGAGKTQLCVQFGTGSPIVLATEV